jgi:hypothetical protein
LQAHEVVSAPKSTERAVTEVYVESVKINSYDGPTTSLRERGRVWLVVGRHRCKVTVAELQTALKHATEVHV